LSPLAAVFAHQNKGALSFEFEIDYIYLTKNTLYYISLFSLIGASYLYYSRSLLSPLVYGLILGIFIATPIINFIRLRQLRTIILKNELAIKELDRRYLVDAATKKQVA
jgi:hypothetical protein